MKQKEITKAQQQADFCAVLGNVHRIQIVWTLGNREMTVSEISEEIKSSMQNTSQHLRLMKDRGVLVSRKDGREIYYKIADTKYTIACPVLSRNR